MTMPTTNDDVQARWAMVGGAKCDNVCVVQRTDDEKEKRRRTKREG